MTNVLSLFEYQGGDREVEEEQGLTAMMVVARMKRSSDK